MGKGSQAEGTVCQGPEARAGAACQQEAQPERWHVAPEYLHACPVRAGQSPPQTPSVQTVPPGD